MKSTRFIICILLASFFTTQTQAQHNNHQDNKSEPQRKEPLSPRDSTSTMFGEARIRINYSSPRMRNRVIFGGLVAYDTLWRAGASRATTVETNKDLMIDNKTLPAGTYALFVIPRKNKWTVIFNSRWNQHGKDEYSENENVLTVEIIPGQLTESQEALKYTIEKNGEKSGTILLTWEKTRIAIPFHF